MYRGRKLNHGLLPPLSIPRSKYISAGRGESGLVLGVEGKSRLWYRVDSALGEKQKASCCGFNVKRRLGQSIQMSVTVKRLLIVVVIAAVFVGTYCDDDADLTFPSGFRLGTASSSYQVEGGWNASDKGENNWDHFTHYHRDAIADHRDGDVACDSYHKYKEDVALIKSIGMDFYRFSISWSRILPTGFTNKISKDGLQYYKNLTAELLANGIEPIVTIYHWDHPQPIDEMGGWTNEMIVDWFVDYARVLFEALGDSVKRWTTINEPHSVCDGMTKSLDEQTKRIWFYLCGHNVLKAHAKTYRMYDAEFRAIQQGQISIVLAMPAFLPANSSDTEAAEIGFQFNAGWMAHPIYKGDYPEIMKKRVAMFSAYQGYVKSLLPVFSEEWISIINGTADFFAFNHYTSYLVTPDPDEEKGIYNTENGLIATFDPSWPSTISPWMKVNAPGFGYLIRKIRDEYGNPPVWVTENGYPDAGELKDYNRISYYHGYMREMLIAINRDGCNVQGYAAWSILDNFEWNVGYTVKFGIVNVDFNDPNRTRTAKLSTSWWKSIVASRKLQPVPKDETSSDFVTMKIVTQIYESDPHYTSK